MLSSHCSMLWSNAVCGQCVCEAVSVLWKDVIMFIASKAVLLVEIVDPWGWDKAFYTKKTTFTHFTDYIFYLSLFTFYRADRNYSFTVNIHSFYILQSQFYTFYTLQTTMFSSCFTVLQSILLHFTYYTLLKCMITVLQKYPFHPQTLRT